MSTRNTPWPAGTPCWAELMAADKLAAVEFYSALFGWQIEMESPEHYATARVRGSRAAGITDMRGLDGHPPVWNNYLATDDADATSAAIEAAGGTIEMPTMEVRDLGRFGVALAPGGGAFCYWQAMGHPGAEIVNEPGAFSWSEFMCREYDKAKDFYAEVFGYTYTEMGEGGYKYATIELEGRTVGGIGELPAEVPSQVPPHWRVYFAVDDTDASCAKLTELGGRVQRPPTDSPYGRIADVADAQGAMFSIITLGPDAA